MFRKDSLNKNQFEKHSVYYNKLQQCWTIWFTIDTTYDQLLIWIVMPRHILLKEVDLELKYRHFKCLHSVICGVYNLSFVVLPIESSSSIVSLQFDFWVVYFNHFCKCNDFTVVLPETELCQMWALLQDVSHGCYSDQGTVQCQWD